MIYESIQVLQDTAVVVKTVVVKTALDEHSGLQSFILIPAPLIRRRGQKGLLGVVRGHRRRAQSQRTTTPDGLAPPPEPACVQS